MYRTVGLNQKGRLLLGSLGIFCLLGILLAAVGGYSNRQVLASAESRPVIVLDPGHGGVDPGAIGVNGAEEKAINLAISLCLRDMLTAGGFEVVMTREEDVAIHDPQYKKITQIKTSDLKKRLQIIEEHPQAIGISIHQNHFTQEKYRGAQMFYGRNNPQSPLLAESLQTAFREKLQPDNQRAVKRSTSDVYIIHNATVPIVLVECGFLSNSGECAQLCDGDYQRQVAFTIYCGILEYLGQLEAEALT